MRLLELGVAVFQVSNPPSRVEQLSPWAFVATSRGTITVTGPSNWVHLDGRKGITIEELTFGALNTRSGPIDVGRAAGKVHLHTHGGNASVRADDPTELLISTGGGDVEVSGQWKEDALDIREEGGKVTFLRG